MNMEKSCQQKNSDSSKKFVRKPFIAIRRGPVLYTPKNAIFATPGASHGVCARACGTGCGPCSRLIPRGGRKRARRPQSPMARSPRLKRSSLHKPRTLPPQQAASAVLALFPRYPLGACLGARTLCMNSIGWILAPLRGSAAGTPAMEGGRYSGKANASPAEAQRIPCVLLAKRMEV